MMSGTKEGGRVMPALVLNARGLSVAAEGPQNRGEST